MDSLRNMEMFAASPGVSVTPGHSSRAVTPSLRTRTTRLPGRPPACSSPWWPSRRSSWPLNQIKLFVKDMSRKAEQHKREVVLVSYVIQLLVFFVEAAERDPERVRLSCGFYGVHSLHSFSVGVYYLHQNKHTTQISTHSHLRTRCDILDHGKTFRADWYYWPCLKAA